MYPNEMELQWSVLIVLYPYITGLVAGAFILASLERVFQRGGREAHLPPGAADRARVPAGGAAAAAAAPRAPGALARDVPDAPHHLGHGHVRLRLPLVPDGRAAARDLARLPPGHRAAGRRPRRARCGWSTGCSPSAPTTSARRPCASTTGWATFVTLIGIPSAFLLHGYVGFIFGSVKANPWWSTPLMPIVFLFSAIVSGIAAVMLLYMAVTRLRGAVIDMDCLDTIARYLFYAFVIDFSLEMLDLIHRIYEADESFHTLDFMVQTRLYTAADHRADRAGHAGAPRAARAHPGGAAPRGGAARASTRPPGA